MAGRFAVLCSGQGSQHPGMLDILYADPLAWQAWQQIWRGHEAAAFLATSLSDPLPDSLPDSLPYSLPDSLPDPNTDSVAGSLPAWQARLQPDHWRYANRPAQTLIVAYQLALWQALAGRLPPPALVAGYSVGEIGAQLWAGSLGPDAIMPLVIRRAALMDQAAQGVAQGLLAVSGGAWQHWPDWHALLAAHGAALAIDNGEAGCVIGAAASNLDVLAGQLAQRGARVQRLPVQVASHTPLMQAAHDAWLMHLNQQPWQRPRCTLLAGCDGNRLSQAAAIAPALARQMVAPVRWAACMARLAEAGIAKVLETGPGSALARMLQAHWPAHAAPVAVRSLADFRSLDAAVAWLERQ